MLVLDRVLDGDDVPRLGAIDLADQRRQRGRLAGAGRSADEHQTARGFTSSASEGGRRSCVSVGTSVGSARTAAARVPRWRCTFTRKRHARRSSSEAARERRSEKSAEPSVSSFSRTRPVMTLAKQRLDVFRRERGVGRPGQASADAKHRRRAGDEQQIAGAALRHFDEQTLERVPLGDAGRRPRQDRARFALVSRLGMVELANESFQLRVPRQFGHQDRLRMNHARGLGANLLDPAISF